MEKFALETHRKLAILEEEPGVFGVRPMLCRGPSANQGLAQDALVLLPGTISIPAGHGDLGYAPHGLIAYAEGGRPTHAPEGHIALRCPSCSAQTLICWRRWQKGVLPRGFCQGEQGW